MVTKMPTKTLCRLKPLCLGMALAALGHGNGFAGVATPLFSVLIGILLLGEVITVPIAFGTVLLLVGVWSLNYF